MIKAIELPKYFGINERTIRKWLTNKKLTGIKRKGTWYVGKQDLLYFMEKHPEYAYRVVQVFADYNIALGKTYNVSQRY